MSEYQCLGQVLTFHTVTILSDKTVLFIHRLKMKACCNRPTKQYYGDLSIRLIFSQAAYYHGLKYNYTVSYTNGVHLQGRPRLIPVVCKPHD